MKAENSVDDIDSHSIHFKLQEGFVLKSVLDFCQIAFDTLIFKITKRGFYMSADNKKHDTKETVLCNLFLPRESFELWRIPEGLEETDDDDVVPELKIPVDASNFKNLTTGILKKDLVILWVSKDNPEILNLEIQNADKERKSSGSIKLINAETLPAYVMLPVLPFKYDVSKPNATVKAAEFQKACKAGVQIKATDIYVEGYPKSVIFSMGTAEVSKFFRFGEETKGQQRSYAADFAIKGNMAAVVKCCAMTSNVRIYCTAGAPMMLGFSAGKSGTFDIHLVPNHKIK